MVEWSNGRMLATRNVGRDYSSIGRVFDEKNRASDQRTSVQREHHILDGSVRASDVTNPLEFVDCEDLGIDFHHSKWYSQKLDSTRQRRRLSTGGSFVVPLGGIRPTFHG